MLIVCRSHEPCCQVHTGSSNYTGVWLCLIEGNARHTLSEALHVLSSRTVWCTQTSLDVLGVLSMHALHGTHTSLTECERLWVFRMSELQVLCITFWWCLANDPALLTELFRLMPISAWPEASVFGTLALLFESLSSETKVASTGQHILCATVVLDQPTESTEHRVGSALYEACRSNKIELPNFPQYAPLVDALKGCGGSDNDAPQLKVTIVRNQKLLILQSLARKWLEYESTQEMASDVIAKHNAAFCPGEASDLLEDDERTDLFGTINFWMNKSWIVVFYCSMSSIDTGRQMIQKLALRRRSKFHRRKPVERTRFRLWPSRA